MSKKYNLYLGKAGQLATMSFFLMRGWNVATPEVDVGDDLFVVEDKKGLFYRVQVKTAQSVERKNGYSVQFNVGLTQLKADIDPDIYYVFVICRHQEWSDKMIMLRSDLFDLYNGHKFGSVSGDSLILYITFQDGKIFCSGKDLTFYRNNFEGFPAIVH